MVRCCKSLTNTLLLSRSWSVAVPLLLLSLSVSMVNKFVSSWFVAAPIESGDSHEMPPPLLTALNFIDQLWVAMVHESSAMPEAG